jgi:2-dehydropantoate 2-reductase
MKNIAILGAGRIGSAFAYHLARVGHDVTVVARGKRLDELVAARAIVDVSGQRSPATIAGALDPTIDFDAVLVTVLAHQLDDALPAIGASRAKKVIFLLNTFAPLDRLRDAVGAQRAVFGFPVILADFEGGLLKSQVDHPGQGVTIDDAEWAEVFRHANIPAKVERDMESWLRAHVAAITPLMAAGRVAHGRGGGLSWAEATQHARAIDEGFGVVRALGHSVIPTAVAAIAHMPTVAKAGLLWSLSRSPVVTSLGEKGPDEPRALIDAMIAAAPSGTATGALAAIRP